MDDFDLGDRPSLCKRKDFLDTEEEAKSHPNRTYYYRKSQDPDRAIEACTKKLVVGYGKERDATLWFLTPEGG